MATTTPGAAARWRIGAVAGAALVLTALAGAGCSGDTPSPTPAKASSAAPAPRPVVVSAATVVERPVVEHVTFIGTVEPSIAATVGAEVAGQVVEAPGTEGDRVTQGQTVLARIDTGPREIQLREAAAAVAKARQELEVLRQGSREEEIAQRAADVAAQKALLDRAEADFHRAEQLYQRDLISRAELQRFESEFVAAGHRHRQLAEAHRMSQAGPRPAEIARAEAEVAAARARADRIRDEIRRSRVMAPLSGFLVRKRVEVGAWVQPGTPVADVIRLDPAFATGRVGEREIRRVQIGQAAALTLDAYPQRAFSGTVSAVVPDADAASRTFPVKVTVSNPDGLLKAGMFARVAVRTGGGHPGLFVPRDAVLRRGGQQLVFVVEGDAAQLVRVETGTEEETLVEVRASALRAGQRVVTLGNEFLQPGMRVEVQ